MKSIVTLAFVALLASASATERRHKHHQVPVHHSQQTAFPDKVGDKNPDTPEASWEEYKAKRPNEHDCHINETKNWFGNHRCRFSWECKGAARCEVNNYGHQDTKGIGWCRGPDACPLVGPLDEYKEVQSSHHENPDDGLKWNKGTHNRRDLDEWE